MGSLYYNKFTKKYENCEVDDTFPQFGSSDFMNEYYFIEKTFGGKDDSFPFLEIHQKSQIKIHELDKDLPMFALCFNTSSSWQCICAPDIISVYEIVSNFKNLFDEG